MTTPTIVCPACGNMNQYQHGMNFCKYCGRSFSPIAPPFVHPSQDEITIRRLADYEQLSGIFWIVLGIIQTLTIIGGIAGLWNIYAGYTAIKVSGRIRARDPEVPQIFESLNGLIIIGVINLVLGAAIGLLFVAFDFYVRDMVLKNAHLFNGATPYPTPQPANVQAYQAPPASVPSYIPLAPTDNRAVARIVAGPSQGGHPTWICAHCRGYVRVDAHFCKHCGQKF